MTRDGMKESRTLSFWGPLGNPFDIFRLNGENHRVSEVLILKNTDGKG